MSKNTMLNMLANKIDTLKNGYYDTPQEQKEFAIKVLEDLEQSLGTTKTADLKELY